MLDFLVDCSICALSLRPAERYCRLDSSLSEMPECKSRLRLSMWHSICTHSPRHYILSDWTLISAIAKEGKILQRLSY
uniref:Membrane protein BRI3 n=1 Tax=Parascaris univalens TaxID=6257 RepID=A0A914ZQL2_PARUN